MTSMSEQLSMLSDRTKVVEGVVTAAQQRDRDALEAERAALQGSLAAARESASREVDEARAAVQESWNSMRTSVEQRFAEMRAAADERRTERNLHRAEHRADLAEQDAVDAIGFALYVLDQAEYAIIDAVSARADADELARG